MMNRKLSSLLCIALLSMLLWGCGKVAITGRKQMILFGSGQITSLSEQSFQQVMETSQPSQNKTYTHMVEEVGQRMVAAVDAYMRGQGYGKQMDEYQWGFHLVSSPEVNAFCLPHGKIVFYDGIMGLTNTPDKVAVVMGHEIAHAIARHGNERMSQQATASVFETAAQVVGVVIPQDTKTQMLFSVAFGLGSALGTYGVLLPYSRTHEYEADRLGLIIMAMAGYDIQQAPLFWEAMQKQGGNKPPEFLSTHPSDANRVAKIREVLSEAETYRPK